MALLLAACGSTDLSKATKPFREGQFAKAADEISGIKGSGVDGVWIQMEKGSILKAAGRHAESQAALAQCQDQMDALLSKAGEESIAVGGLAGAGAVMTDDRQVSYVGTLYEAQLVCALQAMNGLLMSDLGQAQTAISSLRARVDEADEIKARAREYLDKKRAENEEKAQKDAGAELANYEGAAAFTAADDKLKEAYASWADSALGIGLYLGAVIDRESGRGSDFPGLILRSAGEAKKLSYLADNGFYQSYAKSLEAAAGKLNAVPSGPTTYVIIESGLAPRRVVDGDLLQSMQQKYGLDVQIPALSHDAGRVTGGWKVSADGAEGLSADMICSISVLKQNEFDINYPDIRYRAVLGKIIKKTLAAAGAATALASKDKTAQYIGAAAWLIGSVASALQGADLRSWDCIPSAYYAVALPTPDSGMLAVSARDSAAAAEVAVTPGVSNFVVITSLDPSSCIAQVAPLQVALPSVSQ